MSAYSNCSKFYFEYTNISNCIAELIEHKLNMKTTADEIDYIVVHLENSNNIAKA